MTIKLSCRAQIRLRLRPDLAIPIRPNSAPAGFGKPESGTALH